MLGQNRVVGVGRKAEHAADTLFRVIEIRKQTMYPVYVEKCILMHIGSDQFSGNSLGASADRGGLVGADHGALADRHPF